jgi:hypothetical protein
VEKVLGSDPPDDGHGDDVVMPRIDVQMRHDIPPIRTEAIARPAPAFGRSSSI